MYVPYVRYIYIRYAQPQIVHTKVCSAKNYHVNLKSGVNSQVMFKQKLHKRKSRERKTVCILESMVGVFYGLKLGSGTEVH